MEHLILLVYWRKVDRTLHNAHIIFVIQPTRMKAYQWGFQCYLFRTMFFSSDLGAWIAKLTWGEGEGGQGRVICPLTELCMCNYELESYQFYDIWVFITCAMFRFRICLDINHIHVSTLEAHMSTVEFDSFTLCSQRRKYLSSPDSLCVDTREIICRHPTVYTFILHIRLEPHEES